MGKADFHIVCQGKQIVMSNGGRILTIHAESLANCIYHGRYLRDAGVTVERFRELLSRISAIDDLRTVSRTMCRFSSVEPLFGTIPRLLLHESIGSVLVASSVRERVLLILDGWETFGTDVSFRACRFSSNSGVERERN